jgi:hypothetical protein
MYSTESVYVAWRKSGLTPLLVLYEYPDALCFLQHVPADLNTSAMRPTKLLLSHNQIPVSSTGFKLRPLDPCQHKIPVQWTSRSVVQFPTGAKISGWFLVTPSCIQWVQQLSSQEQNSRSVRLTFRSIQALSQP